MDRSAIVAFCEDLRSAREYQRVTLEEVARITRIAPEYLTALENGDWDSIPAAYIQGYLGLYASAVGMNRDKVLLTFRQLTQANSSESGTIVDKSVPLVRQPERVGVTRAKASVSWMARISMNRTAAFIITILTILILTGLARWSKSLVAPQIPLTPISLSLADYNQLGHGAYRAIPLNSAGAVPINLSTSNLWIQIVAQDSGRFLLSQDNAALNIHHFFLFDTVDIQYVSTISLKVFPARSAQLFKNGQLLSPLDSTKTDTSVYNLPDKQEHSVPVDLAAKDLKTAVDSAP
jgi:hypothetical protein